MNHETLTQPRAAWRQQAAAITDAMRALERSMPPESGMVGIGAHRAKLLRRRLRGHMAALRDLRSAICLDILGEEPQTKETQP